MLDLTAKGKETAKSILERSKRPVEDAKLLISRFKDGERYKDTYSVGLVAGAKEFLKGRV